MRSLFRPEVLQAQQQQWLGRVQLVQPLSVTLMCLGALAVAAALLAFLVVGQYTRKATADGVLMPDRGLIRLVPAAAGTVVERHVAEGQAVQAGDVLFVLALERALLAPQAQAEVRRSLEERRRSLRQAAEQERSLLQSRQSALDRRLQALAMELAQVDSESALQRQRLALAQESLARLASLAAEQFISSAQVQAKNEEVLGLRAAGQALERQRAALTRERAELEGDRHGLPLASAGALAAIERETALLAREAAETDAEHRLVMRAPQAGTLSAVLAEPGQSVTPASAMAQLVPEGAALQAHLFAPSSAIGFVRPEQTVRLRYEAFPYQKFGHQPGRVLEVSRTPLAASELAALALPAVHGGGEPMFRITVGLDRAEGQAAMPLAAGMRLQADLQLERRRLIEWLFEPLLGLSGRV